MTRALVIAPQWIGYAVMAEPMLAVLAARGEHLTVAALPSVAPLFQAMPQVAEVITLPFVHGRLDWSARRAQARQIKGRFDVAYVLPNSLKSALLPWLARIPRRVGYQGEGRLGLLNERLPNPVGEPPLVAFYGALAGGLPPRARPRLHLAHGRVDDVLARCGLAPQAYWVLAPGAEQGATRRWPAAAYAALAEELHALHGQPVWLVGAETERLVCEEIAALVHGGHCRVQAGAGSLADAMALIAVARGVVSNDSGWMHMAAAFGVPQAAVFGATSPQHTPPLNRHARVLWLQTLRGVEHLDCQPCYAHECRFGHLKCLSGIAPERVHAALQDALASSAARPG